jgi:uncharacterized protein
MNSIDLDNQELPPPATEQSVTIADGLPRKLDPRFIPAEAFANWITTAVLAGLSPPVLLVLWAVNWLPTWGLALGLAVALVLTLFLVWLTPRHPRWIYNNTHYVVRPDGVEIHRGIFWKHIINVPRSRVQHTDVSQGPVLRRFGLATLKIHTAGLHFASVELAGISHDTAIAIRDFLLHRDERDAH